MRWSTTSSRAISPVKAVLVEDEAYEVATRYLVVSLETGDVFDPVHGDRVYKTRTAENLLWRDMIVRIAREGLFPPPARAASVGGGVARRVGEA